LRGARVTQMKPPASSMSHSRITVRRHFPISLPSASWLIAVALLAAPLLRRPGPRVLYVLDEPTTGLHMGDVGELLNALQRLLDGGASVVAIEHNLDVIKQADWVIDLGPGGGAEGGEVVFQGTPEALAASGRGHTARYLVSVLALARGATA